VQNALHGNSKQLFDGKIGRMCVIGISSPRKRVGGCGGARSGISCELTGGGIIFAEVDVPPIAPISVR